MVMTSLPEGFRALVIGSSGGIGSAVSEALRQDGRCAEIATLSRSEDGLDITDEACVRDAAAQLEGEFHLIFCATGALTIDGVGPEKALKQLHPDAMMKQFALNALGPALILKHFATKMVKRERGLIAFLSARVGSIGDNHLGGWMSYRVSKAALNQIIRTASIEFARTHSQSVLAALHPGTVATSLSEDYSSGRERFRPEESAAKMLAVLDGLQPEQSGNFFAYDGSSIEW